MTQDNTPHSKTQSESHENSNKNPMLSACISGAVVGSVVYGVFYASEYWDQQSLTQKTKTNIAFTMHDSLVAEKANRSLMQPKVPIPTPQSHSTFSEELEEQRTMLANNKSVAESVGVGPIAISLAVALGVAAVQGLLSNKPLGRTPKMN